SISCMSLFFYDGSQVELAILASIIASIGFSGSLVFYDAFLPEIATPDKHDQVSAKGYSFGYFGSVLLLVFNLFMIKNYELFGLGNEKEAMQFSFLMVGIWWIAFSQITFYMLKEDSKIINHSESLIYDGYKELKKVFIKFSSLSQIRIFLLSYFFYNTGVQTVILLAATFASKVIGMEGGSLIVLILIIQLVAIIGAYFFAWLSKLIGNKSVLLIMITLWAGVCIAAYYTHSEFQFQIVAGIVGFVMGGIQSLSRATFSKLIPVEETDHASYFSFYNVIYYISIVMGTFSYGLIEQITNNMRYNALLLAVWFVIGFIILLKMKFDFLKKSLN
ncbi:MAG: MFS transporter, partial [Cyclobacteriaceae bacterium]|nr:MFS transporter [Cyclobacteriaceae bacterium]